MITTAKMFEFLIAFLWGMMFFFGFGMIGSLITSCLMPRRYRGSFFRSSVRYLLLMAVTVLILRIPEKVLEPTAALLAHANPILLLTLVLLIVWSCSVAVTCLVSDKWSKRRFWKRILKKSVAMVVLNAVVIVSTGPLQEKVWNMPQQKWVSLATAVLIVICMAVVLRSKRKALLDAFSRASK